MKTKKQAKALAAAQTFGLDAPALCRWFEGARRDLPWRHERNPYRVWISEIMLQQTQAQTVVPYFERFMVAFPDVKALAMADEQEVLKLWEGLGYYSRARSLLRCAREIEKNQGGIFPNDEKSLLKLPGIGPYTAGAIMSLAFGLPVPAVDGNVLRVLARLDDQAWQSAKPLDLKKAALHLRAYYASELYKRNPCPPDTLNEALIELGATLCLPRTADCERCPLSAGCLARQNGNIAERPLPKAVKSSPCAAYTLIILEDVDSGQFLLEKRPSSGLLAGLWQFPLLEDHWSPAAIEDYLDESGWALLSCSPLPSKKHVFSHLVWQLTAFHCHVRQRALLLAEAAPAATPHAELTSAWFERSAMRNLAFSSVMQAYRALL